MTRGRPVKDITNQRFDRLVVLGRDGYKGKDIMWKCRCDCGKETTSNRHNLTSGRKKSCGCLSVELKKERLSIHNMAHTSEYSIWFGMRRRCNEPTHSSYQYYGGRGITMCEEWQNDFMAFYNHIGKRPSLEYSVDRINNDGNYEPGNVRWVTSSQQVNNRRI